MTDDPKTALFVSNWFSVSDQKYSGFTPQLVSKLTNAGWDITVTSSRSHRLLRAFDMCATAWRARQQYNVAQIDVFSGPAFLWAEATSWLQHRLHKPYVITLHGGNLPSFATRWPGRVHRLLNSASAVTTPSHFLYNELKQCREDILVLPYALDLMRYEARVRSTPRPRLAWLRAFHQIYAPAVAVEVVSRLKAECPDIALAMFGPDKHDGSWERVKATANTLGVSDKIITPGAIPKATVPEKLASFDVFLNTTTAESFGVSVMEAAALGMCIVTTNVGELPYLWTDGEDALLVPPNDPDAMAAAVRRILTEPGLAERLSYNARKKAEQFTWSVILPQWVNLLLRIQVNN